MQSVGDRPSTASVMAVDGGSGGVVSGSASKPSGGCSASFIALESNVEC